MKRLLQISLLGGAVTAAVVWWGGQRPHEVVITRSHLPEAKSEDEFRKMVNAVAQVGIETPKENPMIRFGLPGAADTSEQDRAAAAKQAELDVRLKQVLGERRVAEQAQEEQARQAEEQKRLQEQDENQ